MLIVQDSSREQVAGVLPLSWPQEGLWFFEQAAPGTSAYNIAEGWWLRGALNVVALQQSLDAIAQRHETLRTAIGSKDGKPCQIVFPPRRFPLQAIDLRGSEEARAEAMRHAEAEAREPFNLTAETLARVTLFQTDDHEHLMVVNMHHLISDASSVGLFIRELAAFYTAHLSGQTAVLPELPIQYGNFALWQREMLQGDRLRENLEYWTKHLRGAPPLLTLPTDRLRPSIPTFRGAAVFTTLPASLTARIRELARNEGTTVFRILFSAFNILLQRYTLQDDIVVGTPFAGRDDTETEDLIGFFVNTHALRTNLAGDPTFVELLGRVREASLGAALHEQTPFRQIVRALETGRNGSANPLFQVVFGLQSDFTEDWSLPGIEARRVNLDSGSSKFDLTVLATASSSGCELRFEYNSDLFDAATVERWSKQFGVLLSEIVAEPARRISAFALDTAEERRRFLARGAGTAAAYERDSCVHEIFARQAEQTPSAVALSCEGRQIIYGEVDHRANMWAARLAAAGVNTGAVVGLCLERSWEMIVGMLAILKAGGAYLPVDPTGPRARNEMILADGRVNVVLTRERWRDAVSGMGAAILCIDAPSRELCNPPETTGQRATDIAYVMHTSGSTGRPKGVEVTHRGIARLARNPDYIQIKATDVFLQLAPASFDASTFEIWGALLNGAKLVIHPPLIPSLEELGRTLQKEGITILWLTSGWFNQMVDCQLDSLQGLRYLLAGGEALSVPRVVKATRELKNCQLINGYGPTENTTFTCCYSFPRRWAGRASAPIGRPIANTQVYILDAAQNPVAEGAVGEIYIGGDGLARGYLNDAKMTAAKFVAHPLTRGRVYRSGDLGRWLADGNIEFLGRKDEQVKIRGFRVELGEIETTLTSHPTVREALVVAHADHSETKQLAAYVVFHPHAMATSSELREYLASRVPTFMIPSHFVALEKLPLTANGKIDRGALPAPENFSNSTANEPVLPRNASELALAEIWRDILGRDQIGIYENFFHVGGHSLLVLQVLSRVARTLRVEMPVQVFFENPTIAGLAGVLAAADRATEWQPIPAAAKQDSRAQRILERLDDLSDNEVEELLLELEEEEVK